MRLLSVLPIALLSACSLNSLPPARPHTCGTVASTNDLWRCIGVPDQEHREGGFRSTMRLVYGDLLRRHRNQSATTSCDRAPRPAFERIELNVGAGRAPLIAYFHRGEASMPIIFVVHGLFDSNADRYVRVTAEALANQSFGVVVPDTRWHGCLLSNLWLSTLGVEEGRDLVAWAHRIRSETGGDRRVGLVGFSLGGLNVITAMTEPEATASFDAGGIAISPPADLGSLVQRLDGRPSLVREPRSFVFLSAFRSFLTRRLQELTGNGNPQRPFSTYVAYVAAHWPSTPSVAGPDEVLARAEPTHRLSRVRRPLLILTSASDPILGATPTRVLEQEARRWPYVDIVATRDGGHVGQLGRYPQWLSDTMRTFFIETAGIPPASDRE